MEYFIGLSFKPGSIHYDKIDVFRKRFDAKYSNFDFLQLSLVPSFTIDFKNKESEKAFKDELTEILESYLYGLNEASQIEFNGINFSMGKKGMLALTPIISPDIIHCQEALHHFLKKSGAKFKKKKISFNPLLIIGRFDFSDGLEAGIEVAKIEFSSPFVMNAVGIRLYEKNLSNIWQNKTNLYDFENRDHFFFVDQKHA